MVKDEELDKIIGLEFGVDDYMIKLFSLREVVVRIKVILCWIEGKVEIIEEIIEDLEVMILIGDLKILLDSYEVYL